MGIPHYSGERDTPYFPIWWGYHPAGGQLTVPGTPASYHPIMLGLRVLNFSQYSGMPFAKHQQKTNETSVGCIPTMMGISIIIITLHSGITINSQHDGHNTAMKSLYGGNSFFTIFPYIVGYFTENLGYRTDINKTKISKPAKNKKTDTQKNKIFPVTVLAEQLQLFSL